MGQEVCLEEFSTSLMEDFLVSLKSSSKISVFTSNFSEELELSLRSLYLGALGGLGVE